MALGAKLQKLRLKRGESLQDVADAVGCSKAHLWQVEKGISSNPSMELLTSLADHFDLTVATLVGEDLDAPDEEKDLARMFRRARNLSDHDRKIIDDMIKNMLKRKAEGEAGPKRRK